MKTALALLLLTNPERAALQSARPGSRSVVWRNPIAQTSLDPLDQPLPRGFKRPRFIPYVSALAALTPAEDAAARAEGEADASDLMANLATEAARERETELAAVAVSFVSDVDSHPFDYSPDGDHSGLAIKRRREKGRATVRHTASHAVPIVRPDNKAANEHEALRLAILDVGASSGRASVSFRQPGRA